MHQQGCNIKLQQLRPMRSAQTVVGMHKDMFIVTAPSDDLDILHSLSELPLYGFGNMADDCQ